MISSFLLDQKTLVLKTFFSYLRIERVILISFLIENTMQYNNILIGMTENDIKRALEWCGNTNDHLRGSQVSVSYHFSFWSFTFVSYPNVSENAESPKKKSIGLPSEVVFKGFAIQ